MPPEAGTDLPAMVERHALLALLAAELDAAFDQLDQLGAALCASVHLRKAYLHHLQALDHVGQRCASVATILRSSDLHAAIRSAPLESIARRLEAARA